MKMKKILYSLLAAGLMLTSCDMDVKVPGALEQGDAIQNITGLRSFRNQAYNILRSTTTGSWVTDPDLQADYYIGLRGNGSRTSRQIQGAYLASSSETSGKYQSAYSNMKNLNFAISEGNRLIEEGAISADEMVEANRYIGELKFTRAYLYYYLFDHYCQPYTADKGDTEGLGCQIVTVYNPSIPASEYPGRSSMNATLKVINDDLADAYTAIKAYEATDASNLGASASYLNSATVRALQARVALLSRDFTNAYNYAKEVTETPGFSLATGQDYIDMWTTDESSELLFVPFANASESAQTASLFNTYNYISEYPTRVNCIPTMYWLAQYDDNDIRFDAFFNPLIMTVDAQPTAAFTFNKYPGNPSLNTSQSNDYRNKAKPFRLSEQYLILAEAAYELNNGSAALRALNDLRAARIGGYQDETLSGTALRDAIRMERAIELIGEGFRLSDLRRWGLGFSRYDQYGVMASGTVDVADLFVLQDVHTTYVPNDYRYTWPIPYDEIQVCNALKGQQNPGY